MSLRIDSETGMEALGGRLASVLEGGEIIYLQGELGAGKTTLVRGLLRGLGHGDKVKSPTYTLVEQYDLASKHIYHFDLYRLNDPEELEDMGIRDYCEANSVCLFEWPERASGVVPPADLIISIAHAGSARDVEIRARTETGQSLLATIT